MKKKKLALLSLFSFLTLAACAPSIGLDDFDYHSFHNDVVATKYYGTEKDIVFTDATVITRDTFSFNENIEHLTLDVYNIPAYAFEGCKNLKSIHLKSYIVGIDEYAFKGCTNLETIEINGYLKNVKSTAFLDCNNLKSITMTLDAEFRDHSKKTLYNLQNHQLVLGTSEIPNDEDITRLSNNSFYGRNALTYLNVNEHIEEVGYNVIGGCSNLTRISVDKLNKKFDSRENCNAIIETNSSTLVAGCVNTIIPNDIIKIRSQSFVDTYITGINIPTSVKSIEQRAYVGNTMINNVSVSVNNNTYDSRNNSKTIMETATDKLILACNASVIPASTKAIGGYAFENTTFETLNIPEGVTTIEDYAFANMKNLKSITLPSTIQNIGKNIFDNCDNLETIVVAADNPVYDSRDNSNAIIEKSTNKIVYGCKNSTIPDSVETIGSYSFADVEGLMSIDTNNVKVVEEGAFMNCENVNSLTISDSVTTIKQEAFGNLSKVETLKIPNSVDVIEPKAFMGLTSLINISVDEENDTYESKGNDGIFEKSTGSLVLGCAYTDLSKVNHVKNFAFYGSKLKKLDIHQGLVFEQRAFSGCRYLNEIVVAENHPLYEIKCSNAVVNKGTTTMILGCNSTSLDMGGVDVIDSYAFEGSGIIGMNIDSFTTSSVHTIKDYAFLDCNDFLYFDMNNRVTNIEANAFKNCFHLCTEFEFRFSIPSSFQEGWNRDLLSDSFTDKEA